MGYATGQFGKNHLGDRDEFLPTDHGFDEFFGNLYHLNAEEEPEQRTYPRDPEFEEAFRTARRDCRTYGRRQRIEDTGPLTKKRMETIDDETSAAAIDFIDRKAKANKPFFCWFNATRMHLRTHVREDQRSPPGLTALTEYADGMVEHDGHVGLAPQEARRSRDRQRHHRHLHDRQRPAREHLAGRCHDAVPQREEHQLGGRVPRARA